MQRPLLVAGILFGWFQFEPPVLAQTRQATDFNIIETNLGGFSGEREFCYGKIGIRDGAELRTVLLPFCVRFRELITLPTQPGQVTTYQLSWAFRVVQSASTRKAGYSSNNGGQQERFDIHFSQVFRNAAYPNVPDVVVPLGSVSRSCYSADYGTIGGEYAPRTVSLLSEASSELSFLHIDDTDWERCAGPNDLPESEMN